MKNTKGFTLVELLAVIVIMGILMMVAIPAVSRTIENTRKDSFVNTAKNYANAALTQWTADGFSCGGITSSAVDAGKKEEEAKEYYILIDTTSSSAPELLQQGGKSPWGNRNVKGYVKVKVYTGTGDKRIEKFYVHIGDGAHVIDVTSTPEPEYSALVRGNVTAKAEFPSIPAAAVTCIEQ